MKNQLVYVLTCDYETVPGETITGVVVGVTDKLDVAQLWKQQRIPAKKNPEYHPCFLGAIDKPILDAEKLNSDIS